MHSITQEELLQYMYSETSIEKTAAIKAALQEDWNLREQYEVLVSAQQSLECATLIDCLKKFRWPTSPRALAGRPPGSMLCGLELDFHGHHRGNGRAQDFSR